MTTEQPEPTPEPILTAGQWRARTAAAVGIGALVAFWVLVVVAELREPNYDPSRDFVSALASEGARSPALGIVALLAFGVAYIASGVVLQGWVGTRFGAALLVVAGLLTWVVALARIHCPGGAAYCGLPHQQGWFGYQPLTRMEPENRFGPHLHGWGVAASYAVVLVAMVWLAWLWRNRDHPLRALGSGAAFVTSLITVPFWLNSDTPGLAQRVWLGILSAWVVLICVRPLVDTPAAPEVKEEPA